MTEAQSAKNPDSLQPALAHSRVDQAHAPAVSVPPGSDAPVRVPDRVAVAGQPVSADAQIHAQADQLTTLLESRQRDLDRRTENLHVQLAVLDRDRCAARLWLTERQRELDERAKETVLRETEVNDRTSRLLAAEADQRRARQESEFYLTEHEREIQQRETQLELANQRLQKQTTLQQRTIEQWLGEKESTASELRRAEADVELRRRACEETVRTSLEALLRRRAEIETRAAEVDAAAGQPSATQQRWSEQLQAQSETLEQRQRDLDDFDALLRQERAELAALRHELETDRQKMEADRKAQQVSMSESQHLAEAQMAEQRAALGRENETLHQRQSEWKRLRDDATRTRREALEMRLATEQVWAQMADPADPDALSHSVERLRQQLAESFSAEAAHMAEDRQELESLRDDLAAELTLLTEQRRCLEEWLADQQNQQQREAARLSDAARDIQRREFELRQSRDQRREEQTGYKQEIRRLTAELNHRPPV